MLGNLAQADAAQRAGVLACGTDSVRGRLLIVVSSTIDTAWSSAS
jgi:hypothetical protein